MSCIRDERINWEPGYVFGELPRSSGICVQLGGLLMLRPVPLNQGTSEVVGLKADF